MRCGLENLRSLGCVLRIATTKANDRMKYLAALSTGLRTCSSAGDRVLIAVSGGSDSVALLRGMIELRGAHSVEIGVGHLIHQLRGDNASHDARWVAELCQTLDLPCYVAERNTREFAATEKMGIEEAARQLRYEWLRETAEMHGYTCVATGHSADDQLETILHNIVRGTGLTGLSGMPQTRGLSEKVTLIRPMLEATREQAREYLASLGQDYREDATNSELDATRNRIRGELIPLLEQQFNPRFGDALLRLARQTSDVQTAIEWCAQQLLDRCLLECTPDRCRLDLRELKSCPRHLVRECLVQLWKKLDWPRRAMGFDKWDRIVSLIEAGGSTDLPDGIKATVNGELLRLEGPKSNSVRPDP